MDYFYDSTTTIDGPIHIISPVETEMASTTHLGNAAYGVLGRAARRGESATSLLWKPKRHIDSDPFMNDEENNRHDDTFSYYNNNNNHDASLDVDHTFCFRLDNKHPGKNGDVHQRSPRRSGKVALHNNSVLPSPMHFSQENALSNQHDAVYDLVKVHSITPESTQQPHTMNHPFWSEIQQPLDVVDRIIGLDTRQVSNSSDEAVASVTADLESSMIHPKVKIVVFENTHHPDSSRYINNGPYRERSGTSSRSHSSNKPLGLTYAMRRTDSGSTFQSLDGLSNAYPLIRKEAKRRKEEQNQKRRSSHQKKKRPKHKSRSSSFYRRSLHESFDDSYTFDVNPLTCFSGSWLNDVLQQRSSVDSPPINTQSKVHRRKSNAEDAAERSKTARQELKRLKTQLQVLHDATGSGAATHDLFISSPPKKSVRFADQLVSQVTYRPYTPQEDIPLLYFQEEELESLEWDRETVSGEQFECQYDEAVMMVRIAFQKRNSSDE